jgi:hypothetical protein
MIRSGVLVALAGCAASTPPQQPQPAAPIANVAPPPAIAPLASSCDLQWLDTADELRVTEVSDGHFGYWEFHADFIRRPDETVFSGVVIGSFRSHPGQKPVTSASELALPRADVVAALVAMRDGAQVPAIPKPRGNVMVSDSSRSLVVLVEATTRARMQGDVTHHVQFFVDEGQTSPQPWRIRNCNLEPSHEARAAMSKAYARFEKLLAHDALYQKLEAQAGP